MEDLRFHPDASDKALSFTETLDRLNGFRYRKAVEQEIAEWLRKDEKPFSDCDCAAHLLETGEWKL